MNAPFSHPHLGPAALQSLSGPHQLFIGGRFVDAKAGKTFDTYDPSSGRVIAKVAAGEAADIDAAVTAARQAFESGPWSRMTGSERSNLMWKLAELIEAHRDELAELESLNNGKPIANIRNSDIPKQLRGHPLHRRLGHQAHRRDLESRAARQLSRLHAA